MLANAFQDEERNQHITDTYVMKIVLDQYLTNFGNMWSGNKHFCKTFNNVLMVLLRVHLAPKREKRKRDYIAKIKEKQAAKRAILSKTTIPIEGITLINKSYHFRRRLFKNEERRKQKYNKKADQEVNEERRLRLISRAGRCQVRLDAYKFFLAEDVKVA